MKHCCKNRIILLVLSFFLIYSSGLFGQSIAVKGRVLIQNQPVEGATVRIPALQLSTITMQNGGFELKLPSNNTSPIVLEISFTGYRIWKATIASSFENIEANLEPDVLNLDGVVVTGTRSKVPVYNSPVIVNTINKRTFEATQSLSLSEGLSFSPGLRVENNCQNCGFTQLRMNGLNGPYSQILINSRPVFSSLAGVYGLDMIPANMIDRIEVVRGGGSVLYGGNAIAGTVNILTKDPLVNSFEVGINQAFTNMEASDRTVHLHGTAVDASANKGISYYAYNRNRDFWDANGDGFSEITKLRNQTLGLDAFWNTSERSKLKVGLYAMDEFRRGGNGFHLAPHQTDITEQVAHQIIGTNLSWESYSKNLRHKYAIYAAGQWIRRQSYYGGGGRVIPAGDTLTAADLLAINAYGNSNDASFNKGFQYTYSNGERWMLIAGIEYQWNRVNDQMPGYSRSIRQTVGTIGSYMQVEWKPIEKLTILAGGRMDRISILGNYDLKDAKFLNDRTMNMWVPRLSAMYQLHTYGKLRASFAQGYRAPQAFDEDLHIETVGGAARFIQLDPSLSPERSNSFTLSYNYSRSKGKNQMSWVVEAFHTRLDNPFILSGQEELPNGVAVITKRNGEGAIVQGMNLEFNLALGKSWVIQTGATLQSAKYVEEEEIWSPSDPTDPTPAVFTTQILRNPRQYGYFTVTYQAGKKWSISSSALFTGTMIVPHVIDPDTEQTVLKNTPAFFDKSFKATYQLLNQPGYRLDVMAGVQNLFQSFQRDFDTGPLRDAGYVYGPMRPRTVFIGLTMKL
jgi:outer membrane receptor for ferrienterochelin and colicins